MSKRKVTNREVKAPLKSNVALREEAAKPAVKKAISKRSSILANWAGALPLIPVFLAVLTSINTLWLGYASDDSQQVLNNTLIKSLKNLPLDFTSGVWSFVSIETVTEQLYYRPLFSVLFTFNYAIFGTNLWGWHLVNVVIHAAATWLVYVVCKEISGRRQLSLITASLFAVHPAHAESVAWISGVTDPWMALFFLSAFYGYLRYRKTGKTYYIGLALALFLLALFAKELAIALPILIAYCELFHFRDEEFQQRLKQLIFLGAVFVVPVAIYLVMRHDALGLLLINGESFQPVPVALMTMPMALVKYLKLAAIPMGYCYQHTTQFVTSIADIRFFLPLALLTALACLVMFSKLPLLKLAAVWFIVLLLPPLAAIRYLGPEYVVQDRYLYLPVMGLCLAVALGIEWLAARMQTVVAARLKFAVVCVLVTLLGVVSFRQNFFWTNDTTLYQRCIAIEPDSAAAHTLMAAIYFEGGKVREAQGEAKKAVELDPQNSGGYLRLSYFSTKLGKVDEAIDYLEQAIAAIPLTQSNRSPLATIHLNLGWLYSQKKDFQQAEEHINKSRELRSRAIGYYHSGLFYFNQKRYDEALAMYQQAEQRLPPNYAPIHLSLAATYEALEQKDRAMAEYNQYLDLAPATAPDREKVLGALQRLQPFEQR